MIDTSGAFVAGYCVAAFLFIAYIATLWIRGRRLRERIEALDRQS
jgi:hypothetical protein